jgi:hypothetical protein
MFNPALIKPVIGFAVGLCTSRVVGQAVRNAVPATTRLEKIQVFVAAGALGSMAAGVANKQAVDDIETVEEFVKGITQGFKQEEEK